MSPASARVELDALEPARAEQLGHAERLRAGPLSGSRTAVWPRADLAAGDAPDHQAADEVVPAERAGLELERALAVDARRRRVLEDGVEQRPQVAARRRPGRGRGALDGRAVDRPGSRAGGRRRRARRSRSNTSSTTAAARCSARSTLFTTRIGRSPWASALPQHEAGLRHRAVDRVHHQQHAVHQAEHALHLAAEVGVAGRVDELDPHALELDRGDLREDRDAPLALEVARVHRALGHAPGARAPRR